MVEKVEKQPCKKIIILLTKYEGIIGRFVSDIYCKNGYSHASISIDEKEELFYSFNYKGFVIEKPKKYFPEKRRKGSACIRLNV